MLRNQTNRLKGALFATAAIALVVTACGGGSGGSSPSGSVPPPVVQAPALSLLVGWPGGRGNADATGTAARFDGPTGTAVDSSGNVYVADSRNHTVRKIAANGVVTTLAGLAGVKGNADASGSAARFNSPGGVAVDNSGNVFVADTLNHTVRRISPQGVVSTIAGLSGPGYVDGTGVAAAFNSPMGIAVDGAGSLYVADTWNSAIRKISSSGVVTTLAGNGFSGVADGMATAARFSSPYGVAVDSTGNVYVADTSNYTIRKINSAGVVTTWAGAAKASGLVNAVGASARFSRPLGITVDGSGKIYVTDGNAIRAIATDGAVTTLAGASTGGSLDGTGSAARFLTPHGVAADAAGVLFIADYSNSTVRKIAAGSIVTTFAGLSSIVSNAGGTGVPSASVYPSGLAMDAAGSVLVAQFSANAIRKIESGGMLTTVAEPIGVGKVVNGSTVVRVGGPIGVGKDSQGNLFAIAENADAYRTPNVWYSLHKITAAGVVSTVIADVSGYRDENLLGERTYDYPVGIAVNASGTVYLADPYYSVIRKVTSEGVMTTLAGGVGFADGLGLQAGFTRPQGIAVDSSGTIYVADTYNHTLRKITPEGLVTTLAGMPKASGSADGQGSAANFNMPTGLAVTSTGVIYVTDTGNHTIRKVSASGAVSTVVGQPGRIGYSEGALPGLLSHPSAIAVTSEKLAVNLNGAVMSVTPLP